MRFRSYTYTRTQQFLLPLMCGNEQWSLRGGENKALPEDSWNDMPPILVPSFAKSTATQFFLNVKKKILFWETLFVMSSVSARNYLFKVSNWSPRIRCDNFSGLRMKTMTSFWCFYCYLWTYFKHILIIDFKQVNVCRVHIENINTFEDNIGYIMRYVSVY